MRRILWLIATVAGLARAMPPVEAAPAAVEFGPVQVLFNDKPAPEPSSTVCGFALVAGDAGPQVALTQSPATCVISLHQGENVSIAVPIRRPGDAIQLTADAELLAGEARVEIAVGDRREVAQLDTTFTELRISIRNPGKDVAIRLRTTAITETAAVRWRNIRLTTDTRRAVPFAWQQKPEGDGPPRAMPAMHKPIEDALIEWDWRMQDGIDTPRMERTYPQAIRRTLEQGDALLADLRMSGTALGDLPAHWHELRRECNERLAAGSPQLRPLEDLWRRVHVLRRQLALSNPLAPSGPVAFVKNVPSIFSHQLTQYTGHCARPGGGVFVLESPGRSMACWQLTGQLPAGSFEHMDVSWESDRLLFAFCPVKTRPRDREVHRDHFYHLYSIAPDGTGLRQLTDGKYDDFSPRFLPDGKILFISTRRGGYHRCGRGPCPVHTLALANGDGSDPRVISFHETHEWDPAVLNDGRVIYTRWDYVDRHAVHFQQLWSIRPDGSDVRIYYGNNTFNPVGVWEARAVPGSHRIMATAGAHHAMTAGSIILVDPSRGTDGLEPLTRLTPDALFPESETPVGPWHAPVGVERPVQEPIEARRWPGHTYRSPYPLSESYFLAAYSFHPLVGEGSVNAANLFGIYLVDRFGNKELLYRDLNISSIWPIPIKARQRPPRVPAIAESANSKEGTFFLQNVYASWPGLPRERITRLRIVQVLPKTTPHANAPTVGVPNASPGKQVLGTVPVEEDGSAYFQAPAGIPLLFQALDERGQAVQVMRSLTYLQPGETATCVGCHEPRTTAPASQSVAKALQRPPSTITPGPDGSKPLSYPLLVQPVLDKKCIACHCAAKPDGKVVLTGEPQGRYSASYNALVSRVSYSAWGGPGGGVALSAPSQFGARGSPLMQLLLKGHAKVDLTPEEIERLATWMDANALFYGTFNPADQARQLRGERIAGPKLE